MTASSGRLRWVLLLVLLALVGAGWAYLRTLRDSRPEGPPPGVKTSPPWGAITLGDPEPEDSALELLIEDSIEDEAAGAFDPDRDGAREYDLLVLSGGGSNGAYGAGVLAGWSASGTRPDFKIVTGVSTGALQATFAFLGSDYDDELRAFYTEHPTEDIYVKRSPLAPLFGESACDTAPLKELIDSFIDEEVLAEVAALYRSGRNLFVGTYDMDGAEFVVWDMGAIADSGRPDARDRYGKVLLASASIPVLFPPVYFEVEAGGETYHQMHVDGGAEAQVCFRRFMLEFDDALDEVSGTPEVHIFVIRNGNAEQAVQRTIAPRAVSIAAASLGQLFRNSINDGIYRTYVLAEGIGADFFMASIPPTFEPDLDATDFDVEVMQRLYDLGYEQAAGGYPWMRVPPDTDVEERIEED